MEKRADTETINLALIDGLSVKARESQRKRQNYNLHELPDLVQRMLNAIEPDSYVRPHRHLDPPKIETFIVLRGHFTVILFDDTGGISDCVDLVAGGDNLGIDIRPGAWHSLVSWQSGGVLFEVKDGPYIPSTDKDFAVWSPEENDPKAKIYHSLLKERVSEFFKKCYLDSAR